ncbi:hypothetical protein N9L47_10295 [Rhodobacteraceae bacterium]|nr:hypothetical protein [Paracoccaceae bacterium]
MLENYVGERRSLPLHEPLQQDVAREDTPKNKDMQQDAAPASDVQVDATPPSEEFTISVEQVRQHFRSKGVSKSKDTVQRWCRTGELSCQKRGVLNRYFTTEASLKVLEQKLLPDMIAETSGEITTAETSVQPDAAATSKERNGMPLYEAIDTAARSGTQVNKDVGAQADAAAQVEPTAVATSSPDPSRLAAENEGLREQLKNRDSQIEFLQEEIRSGREQRGAVVQISNRMLQTLETIAIGGRLERPTQSEPVPYPPNKGEGNRV